MFTHVTLLYHITFIRVHVKMDLQEAGVLPTIVSLTLMSIASTVNTYGDY